VNLWRTLQSTHGLQTPTFAGIEEYVYTTFSRMYEKLEEGKKLLGPDRYYEMKYEDLITDTPAQMRKVYDHFNLGGFDAFLPRLQTYLASVKGYETNKYQITDAQRAEITQRWGNVIRRYGYGG
jgi:hypothetical protein